MIRRLRTFLKDRSANVAVVFGLSALPLVTAVGAAVDYTVASQVKGLVQESLDAAVLMAARDGRRTTEEIDQTVRSYLGTVFNGRPFIQSWQANTLSASNASIVVQASARVPMNMLGIIGHSAVDVSATTEARRDVTNLEVALVLDVTGSMASNNRIGAMRNAATSLVNTLLPSPDPAKIIRVALVPFVTTVNIGGARGFDMNWMDRNAEAQWHGAHFDLVNSRRVSHFDLFTRMNVAWKGCVEARAEPYDIDDTPPTPGNPNTLYVPYFWPDEPDSGPSYAGGTDYHNNYMQDGVSGNDAGARQRSTTKYGTRTPTITQSTSNGTTGVNMTGPNRSCPNPVLPLTDDKPRLLTDIGALVPWNDSGTNIAMGLMWGWHVVSPGEPFAQGRPYEDRTTQKAIILLTDGENQVWGGWNNHNFSHYSGYGYLANGRLGSNDRHVAASNVNTRIATLCARVKAAGIRLYTITFELNSSSVQTLFRQCATTPDLYYNSPTTSDLQRVFNLIGADLTRLRIAR